MASSQKTVAFLGASTGVGLAALKRTLAAGHQCVALCRVPSKLTSLFDPATTPNLRVVQGNAHDAAAVAQCLRAGEGPALVDTVVSTIGGRLDLKKLTLDDPEVCRKGMTTLLEALAALRQQGCAGRPRIVVCGTTGMSRFGRDTPLPIVAVYKILLRVPHADKERMEEALFASGERFTVVHATWLVNGESERPIRVGIEDPRTGRESVAIGYTISREDAGRWMAQNLVLEDRGEYENKIAMITY